MFGQAELKPRSCTYWPVKQEPNVCHSFPNSLLHLKAVVDEKNSKDREMTTAANSDRSIPADNVTTVTRPISFFFSVADTELTQWTAQTSSAV